MGILKHLLFWPVTGPSFLIRFSLNRVHGLVREELTDDSRIKAELMELQLALELGEIDEAGYLAREAELLQQLRDIREWREEFGMGVSGGVVRVQPAAETVETDASADVVTDADARAAAAEEEAARTPDEERVPRVADPGSARIELHLDGE
jgi:hypothetical protein